MEDRKPVPGFTLIELVITIVVVAILSLVAVPSYLGYVQQGRRSDAIASLLHLQLRQAEWRVDHGEYATLEELGWAAGNGNSLDGFYTIVLVERSAGGYRMTAKPLGRQEDDVCGVFALNQSGPVYAGYADAGCWSR